jgi:epoxyqueuosine reductase
MNRTALTARFKEYGLELGIDLVGVTGVEPFSATLAAVIERQQQGLYSPFGPADLAAACDPEQVLPGARSLIAIGLPYYQGEAPVLSGCRGYLSRSAWGIDYHRVVEGKLELLRDFLWSEASGSESICFVDTGPFFDKAVAWRAGLGCFANNTLLATKLGTWVYLGGILTKAELVPDCPSELDCASDCNRCVRSCPTGALVAPGVLDYTRCLSYLTQKKGYIPNKFRKAMGLRLYGCDTCQDNCVVNEQVPLTKHRQFYPVYVEHRPKLLSLLKMSKREFGAYFGFTSAGWRGRTIMQRNALIALGNWGDQDLVPEIQALLQDQRPVIRGHAAWALGQLGGKQARRVLEKAKAMEADLKVQAEIAQALMD